MSGLNRPSRCVPTGLNPCSTRVTSTTAAAATAVAATAWRCARSAAAHAGSVSSHTQRSGPGPCRGRSQVSSVTSNAESASAVGHCLRSPSTVGTLLIRPARHLGHLTDPRWRCGRGGDHRGADSILGMDPVLSGRGLAKRYGGTPALDGVDIDIGEGEVLAVVGPSGSGKTSLLHVLSGIVPADGGEVFLDRAPLGGLSEAGRGRLRRTAFGFVFQSGMLVDELTAEENAALPMLLGGAPRGLALRTARECLGRLGLSGLEARRPAALSGGQAQRVAIALVFADEPTGALDTRTGYEVMSALLEAARDTGAAVVVVTHDRTIADRAHRVVGLQDGRSG